MDIKLIPVEKGSKFTFPALPEKVQGKYAAKYQSFDIISLGTVKVPKGTDVSEFSWDGVFFGASKKNEAIVKTKMLRFLHFSRDRLERMAMSSIPLRLLRRNR